MEILKKLFLKISLLVFISLLISGCGSRGPSPQKYQYHHYFPQSYFGSGENNSDTVALNPYDHSNRGGYNHGIFNDLAKWRSLEAAGAPIYEQNAFSKRKAALFLGRGVIDYCFGNYDYVGQRYESGGFLTGGSYSYYPTKKPLFLICMKFDAVSNLLYNVSYIFSIPAKLIHSTKVADGIMDYIGIVISLAFGTLMSVVMISVGTIVGFICHPFESLANLIVGFDISLSADFIKNLLDTNYIYHVNLIYSLVDLLWGAIVLPLLEIVLLFL